MKYAGIGSRETPLNILKEMIKMGAEKASSGWLLRSGGAIGADKAFESGCDSIDSSLKEIFLAKDYTLEAEEFSAKFHPNWGACSFYARKLHARNAMIILGRYLNDPVDEVQCWTKDGKASGGTGQAMRIAKHFEIPIHNFNKGF